MSRTLLDVTWPERHRRTLAAWIANGGAHWSDKQRDVLARARTVLESVNGGMVTLLGPRGVGKTLLAAALAHNALAQRSAFRKAVEEAREEAQRQAAAARKADPTYRASPGSIIRPSEPMWEGVAAARYWVLADMLAGERTSWQKERNGWERIGIQGPGFEVSPLEDAHRVDLLVLDEIQERAESDWEDRELTRLLDARYRQCRSTVLIGNLKPDELGARLGASIVSRMSDGGDIIACAWESYRGKGAGQ